MATRNSRRDVATGTLAALALAGTLLSGDRAVALTCAYDPATLAENYASALGIVVAEVQGCADGAEPTNGRCPCADGTTSANGLCPRGYLHQLDVLEVLKSSVPPQDFSGTYVGADNFMSCGIVFVPGESYLLFVSGANSINHGASGMLTQNGARTMAHRDTLAILRAYRDGKIDDLVVDDLPEAWTFLDSSLACELQHSAGLTFSYPYVDNYHRYAYSVEYDEKGYATTFAGGPVDPAATDIEVIVEGPNLETHGLVFAARLDVGVSPIPDSATIRVGRRSWRLTTHTMTLRFRGIATAPSVETVIPPSVSDVATDEEAREILQAMLEPQIVVVRKAWTDSEPGRNVQDVAVELRTDHISAEAAKFLACMDGSVRSQPIREGNQ